MNSKIFKGREKGTEEGRKRRKGGREKKSEMDIENCE